MNDLERHVLELIGEDTASPDVFTDDSTGMAPIRDSINDAIEEISMITGGTKQTYYVPLIANSNFYRMDFTDGRLAWITNVWLVGVKRRLDRKDFIWMTSYNPRWLMNSGSPERYCRIGTDIICVHPAPSDSTDILEIDAVVVPDRYVEGTDRIMLRDDFKWGVVHYAVGEYYASRGDAKQALSHHGQYLDSLGIQEMYPSYSERVYQYRTVKKEEVNGLV